LVFHLLSIPERSVLSRRYKALTPVCENFIALVGEHAAALEAALAQHDLYADKSLFKAAGPLWHESDRQAGRVPEKLRNLDPEAT
jgi:hypothetical protein